MSQLKNIKASLAEVEKVLKNLERQNNPDLQSEIDNCRSQIEELQSLIDKLEN